MLRPGLRDAQRTSSYARTLSRYQNGHAGGCQRLKGQALQSVAGMSAISNQNALQERRTAPYFVPLRALLDLFAL